MKTFKKFKIFPLKILWKTTSIGVLKCSFLLAVHLEINLLYNFGLMPGPLSATIFSHPDDKGVRLKFLRTLLL